MFNNFFFFLLITDMNNLTLSESKLGLYWLIFHLTGTSPIHSRVRSAPDVRVSSGTSGFIFTSK